MSTAGTLYDEVIKFGFSKMLMSQVISSTVATVEFTNMTSEYDAYMYDLTNMATDNVNALVGMRVSFITNPSSFYAGSEYYWGRLSQNNTTADPAGTPTNSYGNGGGYLTFFQISTQVVAGQTTCAEVLVNRGSVGGLGAVTSQCTAFNSGNYAVHSLTGGILWNTGQLGGVQFFYNGGNITFGRITQYGLKRGV